MPWKGIPGEVLSRQNKRHPQKTVVRASGEGASPASDFRLETSDTYKEDAS